MRLTRALAFTAIVLFSATAWAQVGGPVEPGDLVVGLSRFDPSETAPLLRGGALIGDWTQAPFLQSMEFDNLNAVPHNAQGNLLAMNWGGGDGGIIWSLATNGSDTAQELFRFDDDSDAGNNRISGLAVSPDNTRIALMGDDNVSLFIMDYQAGNGDGTGAAITGFTKTEFAFNGGGSQSATWLNNNSVLLYRLDLVETNETQLVRADIGEGGNVTLTVVTDNVPAIGGGSNRFADVEYDPAIAPWVFCSHGSFNSGTTTNTLTFIDPNTWEIVHAIDLSQSLQTAREIALGADFKLYMGGWGGSNSGGPTIQTLNLDTDNNGVVDSNDLPGITDNSSEDYFFFNDSNRESSFNGLDFAVTGKPVILSDGVFDILTPGTNPDCGPDAGAGAWFFGTAYVADGVCETDPAQFTIVTTDSFDPGAEGNSLHLNVAGVPNDFHLPNRFNVVIAEGEPVTVAFDLWVVSGGGGGGAVYVGVDGFDGATQRGPQLAWTPDGTVLASFGGKDPVVIPAYPFDEWQSVRMEIDLVADTFDLFWGPRGGQLDLVGDDLGYRSGPLDRLDRITFARFDSDIFGPDVNSYLDNVTVTVGGEDCDPCDMNCSGAVDAFDIEPFLALLFDEKLDPCCGMRGESGSTGDTDGDGDIDAFDIEPFLSCLFP